MKKGEKKEVIVQHILQRMEEKKKRAFMKGKDIKGTKYTCMWEELRYWFPVHIFLNTMSHN